MWDINELLENIKVEVEAKETSNAVKTNENQRELRNHRTPSTAGAFATGVEDTVPNNIRCVYCKESHFSASCERKLTTRNIERIFFINKDGALIVYARVIKRRSVTQSKCVVVVVVDITNLFVCLNHTTGNKMKVQTTDLIVDWI